MATAASNGGASFEALVDGGLDAAAVHALADRIAALHAMADPATPAQIASFRAALTSVARLPQQSAELARHADKLEVRAGMGRMRRLAGESVDVLFDLALPLMELLRSGRKAEANMLANRYLDVAPQGASGWAMLPFYISLRASLAGDEGFAAAALADAPPRMVVIGGLSGTGKSTLARLIGARLGRLPGARVLRSDVLRKRLAGVGPETRLPPRHYTLRNDAETYEALFESAYEHLSCGSSVILDAVFMSRSERDVVEALAARLRVPFSGIWLDAPERDRIARVNERLNDASDATAEVVREQSRRSVGELAHWHRIRVNRPIELIVAAARGFLERDLR